MIDTQELITKHEGIRLHPYKDSVGKLTVGIGHNLDDNGISLAAAQFILEEDIANAVNELKNIFEEWDELPTTVQAVLTDMMFNLGYNHFSGFKRMIAAIRIQDFKQAAKEAKNSKWCKQVSNRCLENVSILQNS